MMINGGQSTVGQNDCTVVADDRPALMTSMSISEWHYHNCKQRVIELISSSVSAQLAHRSSIRLALEGNAAVCVLPMEPLPLTGKVFCLSDGADCSVVDISDVANE